jgi:hypothetical protein
LWLREPWPELLLLATRVESYFRNLALHCRTALYDAMFFPQAHRPPLPSADRPYVLKGVIEEDFGAVTLTVQALDLVELTPD